MLKFKSWAEQGSLASSIVTMVIILDGNSGHVAMGWIINYPLPYSNHGTYIRW